MTLPKPPHPCPYPGGCTEMIGHKHKYCAPHQAIIRAEKEKARQGRGARVGKEMPCDRCGTMILRTVANRKYCPECVKLHAKELYQSRNAETAHPRTVVKAGDGIMLLPPGSRERRTQTRIDLLVRASEMAGYDMRHPERSIAKMVKA